MPYSSSSPVRKCQGACRQRRPAGEFDSPTASVCRICKEARREAREPPAPVPLGDGRTAITLLGKHAHGRVALVSDAKVPRVAPYRWRVMEWTRPDGVKLGPYAVSKGPGGKMLYMHTVVSGFKRVDHKNGNGLDNTDENLRDCTQSQNGANRGKNRTAGASDYVGVRQLPNGSWRARIKVNYKERHLGCYATQDEAVRARDAAAIEAWREFARPNLPVEDSEEMGTDD